MAVCPTCGASYPSTVRLCPTDGTVLQAEAGPDPRVGTIFAGKYQIEARIGRGGMGTIYRATHVMLGKAVAVKIINPELDLTAEIASRFQREARAASQLSHPNIAAVHDLGQLPDGTLYIAMELVDGETLKDLIARDGPVESRRIVHLVKQVCAALAAAHRAGIVHRDLKPQNIMVTSGPGGEDVVKLVDFGIARTMDQAATQLTSTGLSIGTPQYMAPEQASGSDIDGRTDIYSVGVILYEMLTGQVPFDDPSTPAVLVKHLSELPVRPSERRPDLALAPALESIALRCLEKDPTARFQAADDVLAAVESVGSGSAVPARRRRSMPGAMNAPPVEPGDLRRDDGTLPPRSAIRNLTSVGSSGLHVPPKEAGRLQPSGQSGLLVILVLAVIGGVGFAAYALGYFNRPAGESEPQPPATVEVGASRDADVAVPRTEPTEPVQPAEGRAAPAAAPERVRSETPPPAEVQVEPPRPEQPSVRFGCDGPATVCVALQAALDRELDRASMVVVLDEGRAEILVDALVTEGTPTVQDSFGTTFVIQPYTVSLAGSARRVNERVPMPEPRSFSLDQRVGQARLAEQARLIAADVIERVRTYWNR